GAAVAGLSRGRSKRSDSVPGSCSWIEGVGCLTSVRWLRSAAIDVKWKFQVRSRHLVNPGSVPGGQVMKKNFILSFLLALVVCMSVPQLFAQAMGSVKGVA